MSDTDGRPRGRPPHRCTSKTDPFQPGDELATYTHAQLIHFDNRFRRRLLHAFERGLEHKESAAADVFTAIDTPASVLMARQSQLARPPSGRSIPSCKTHRCRSSRTRRAL